MKRLSDLIVASILVLLLSPAMLLIAIAIRLDTPGPVVYASPRVGKGGRLFGFYRFRTADLHKPAYLNLNDRLTRVGRIIRQLSLDDLPNLFNVLEGDLSIIGPRATEPERVDLTDPTWQQILSVRPGLISPAILVLARRYNASPPHLKQQFELDYVQNRSMVSDLKLFVQGIGDLFASKGNWKARGAPRVQVEYTTYQPPEVQRDASIAENPAQRNWQPPDLETVAAFVHQHNDIWPSYHPQFCLAPFGEKIQKPGVFIVVPSDDYAQSEPLGELRFIRWPIVSNNRYLCLGAVFYFEYGLAGKSAGSQDSLSTRRKVFSTVLDVAAPEVETWFSAWRHMPDAPWLFIVTTDLRLAQHVSLSTATGKEDAMAQWEAAKQKLHQSGHALDNFLDERRILLSTLPHRTGWDAPIG